MKLPFFIEIEKSETVLIAGAGGGFDLFCGIPLFCYLHSLGKKVHLANLSFTDLNSCDGERPVPSLVRVEPRTQVFSSYFPEVYLAQWLSARFGPMPIYAIARTGAKPIQEAYRWMAQEFRPDTIVLVDGGTDSLMRGDEEGLGTPQEDAASLFAAHTLPDIPRKFLLCLGFGIDTFHGVSHAHVLENIAESITEGGYLGAWSLMQEMEEFRLYAEACDYAFSRMPHHPSIVSSSIISAARGWFGDRHATKRTKDSELFINPLMPIYWAFHLERVAVRNLYLKDIAGTSSYHDLSARIERFRATLPEIRPWKEIPC